MAAFSREVRAAHLVAEVDQHLGDAAHARAADADEMDAPDLVLHRASSMQRSATTRAASGLPSARAFCAIVEQRPAIEDRISCGERLRREVALRQQDRRALLGQEARVRASGGRPPRAGTAPARSPCRPRKARRWSSRRRGRSPGRPRRSARAMSSMNATSSPLTPASCVIRPQRIEVLLARLVDDRRAASIGSSASAFGTASFSACAPRLPPTTSRRSGPCRPAKRSSGDGIAAISARTGLPVHSASFSAPRKRRHHLVGDAAPAPGWRARRSRSARAARAAGASSEAIMPPGNAT